MSKIIDLAGQRFGRLKAIEICGRDSRQLVVWFCSCDCGKSAMVTSHNLRTGNTKSCGCLVLDENSTTHGMSYSAEHETWSGMKARCSNKANKRYALYGGRGIAVCDRWLSSFENFFADMGPRPSSKYTLDRIDPNADWKTQQNNRRNNRIIEFKGEKLTAPQWGARVGIRSLTILQRIDRDGWSIEKAITTPLRRWA